MPTIDPDHIEDAPPGKIDLQELLSISQTCQLRANVAEQAVGSLHSRVEQMEQRIAMLSETLNKVLGAMEKLRQDLQELSEF